MEIIALYAAWVVGIGAALTLLIKVARAITRKIRSVVQKVSETADSLLGREEIRHPDTGEVLVEATPNIGNRLARIENAVVQLADTSLAVVGLNNRVDAVERRLDNHITDCNSAPTVQVVTESAEVKHEGSV